jgi:hypothetical protein
MRTRDWRTPPGWHCPAELAPPFAGQTTSGPYILGIMSMLLQRRGSETEQTSADSPEGIRLHTRCVQSVHGDHQRRGAPVQGTRTRRKGSATCGPGAECIVSDGTMTCHGRNHAVSPFFFLKSYLKWRFAHASLTRLENSEKFHKIAKKSCDNAMHSLKRLPCKARSCAFCRQRD